MEADCAHPVSIRAHSVDWERQAVDGALRGTTKAYAARIFGIGVTPQPTMIELSR
jgi:hypothetical protein